MGFVMEWLLPYNKHNQFSKLYIAFFHIIRDETSNKLQKIVDFLKIYPSRPLISAICPFKEDDGVQLYAFV